jgi:hypothetical protein
MLEPFLQRDIPRGPMGCGYSLTTIRTVAGGACSDAATAWVIAPIIARMSGPGRPSRRVT